MFDKTITLTGEYPSDFEPTMSVLEIQKHFSAFGFHDARMLGGYKFDYSEGHPDDLVIFNENVLMPGYGKVWFGDLNLTEDYLTLREIAQNLNTDLYILWEMDGRFGEEMKPLNELFDKAVWNTTEEYAGIALKPTKEWYKIKMDKKYNR